MGDTISSLVFRPPRPTPIHPSDYFYLDVDVHAPLCANRSRWGRRGRGKTAKDRNADADDGGGGDGGTTGDGDRDDDCTGGGCSGGGMMGGYEDGGCLVGGAMCLDNGESDLAMLDTNFIGAGGGACSKMNANRDDNDGDGDDASDDGDVAVPNVRNGRVYKVPAFFIRRRNATKTILFSHGNAEDLGMMYGRMKDLALVLGVNVLAYDYTGYGLSMPGPAYRNPSVNAAVVDNGGSCSGIGGNGNGASTANGNGPCGGGGGGGSSNDNYEGPSENMIYRNIEAAYRYLTRVRMIHPRDIVLYGRSLGSGPSCYLAAKTSLNGNPVGGLILHSPFVSVYRVVADLGGIDLGLVGDLFNNEKRARNVRCPTLVIHGRDDEVVPFWHAPRLLSAIPPEYRARPYYVDGMGHNHIESRCREEYVRVVSNFLSLGGGVGGGGTTIREHDDNAETTCDGAGGGGIVGGGCVGGGRTRAHVPVVVPLHERASPTEAGETNSSFYLNKTWIRHARVLLGEVLGEVGGCYVNRTVDARANGNRGRSVSARRGKAGTANVAATVAGTNARHPSNAVEGRPDVRDDEDEFAPWNENDSRRRYQQQQQQQQMADPSQYRRRLSPESILHTRPNGSNTANIQAGGGGGGGRNRMPHYQKSYSAAAMHTTPSSARRALSPPEQDKHGQQRRSKSMVLVGLSRSKRY